MIVLALDTASPRPAVAVLAGGRHFEETLPEGRRASDELLPAVRRALDAAGTSLSSCERIGVCAGPGSFTGLRVGLATAWGFGRALGIPVETVSTLEAMAEAARPSGAARVAVLLDAGRGELVCERFDLSGDRARSLAPAGLCPREEAGRVAPGERLVAIPEDLVDPAAPALAGSVAGALAAAISRSPRAGGADPNRPPAGIYSRPSAAEEKHGAA